MPANKTLYEEAVIPTLLSICSNVSYIPNFPLAKKLRPKKESRSSAAKNPTKIGYYVNEDVNPKTTPKEKIFERKSDTSMIQHTPIGRFSTLSVEFSVEKHEYRITVNPTYHKLGRITAGNAHSVGWLFRDLANIALLHSGATLVHGAALRYGDSVTLLIGLSNTGKTRTSIEAVSKNGAQVFGDDLFAVKDGKAFPCPRTVINTRDKVNLSRSYRAKQWAKRNIPLSDTFLFPTTTSISEYFGEHAVADAAPVTKVLILQKDSENSVRALDYKEAAKLFLSSNRVEFTYTSSPIFSASEFFGLNISPIEASAREASIIEATCGSADSWLMSGDRGHFLDQTLLALGIRGNQDAIRCS